MTPELNRLIAVEPFFSISICEHGGYQLTEAGATLEVTVAAGHKPLYIQRHNLPQVCIDEKSLAKVLKSEVERFVSTGMAHVLGRKPKASVEIGLVDDLVYQQAVVQASKEEWWVARVVSKKLLESYYLLHWVGPTNCLESNVCAMATFSILEKPSSKK